MKDCHYKTKQTVEVRQQHVLKTGIELDKVTDKKLLPKGVRNKCAFIERGLYKISSNGIEDIFQEIRCREGLEHVEEEPNVISDHETNSIVDDTDNDDDISDSHDNQSDDKNVF